ncbi:MAG: DUF1579 domain-containing protein [Phycisphaerae bacterium]|nr:DUF1579 domain-containing protein [Phycisphaerae bacterium]
MKVRTFFYAAALVGVTVFVTNEVVSQEKAPPPTSKPDRGTRAEAGADTESLVDNLVQYSMPGEHHKLLEKMTGRWDLRVKYRMNAEAPVVESEGTCERKWILGKRFLLEEFDGGNLGLPFQGLAIYGYDSFEKKYTSVWVDTMNTAITTSLGTCRDGCREITFIGRHGDPWTGTKRNTRGVTRFVNENEHVLVLYEAGSDGKEYRILEIVYTRK